VLLVFAAAIGAALLLGAPLSNDTGQAQEPGTAQSAGSPPPDAFIHDHRAQDDWFYRQRAFPGTQIPAGIQAQGLLQAQQQGALAGSPVDGPPWTPLGPAPIDAVRLLTPTGAASGRIQDIAVSPVDDNVIYIGAAGGGVWKTTDGGGSWTPLTDRQPSLSMGALAIDPTNADIVYAGTGENDYASLTSYGGAGILKSTDGGDNWTLLASNTFAGCRVGRIAIDPTAPSTLYLASGGAFGGPGSCGAGIYKSIDGGVTWTNKLAGPAWDIELDPSAPATLYAGVDAGYSSGGVYKSIDGGDTWNLVLQPPGYSDVVILAIAPSQPQTVYAALAEGGGLNGVYRTTDGGANWTNLGNDSHYCDRYPFPLFITVSQCWYNNALIVDPADANTVYAGGIDLFKSTDGGAHFADLIGFFPGAIHVDQHALAFDSQGRLYIGNDGGIWRRSGTTFANLNGNLAITQFYPGTAGSVTSPAMFLGGTQDNGTLRYTGSPVWKQVAGGDGGYAAVNPDNPQLIYHTFQYLQIEKSYDGGANWYPAMNGIPFNELRLFIAPLVMSPSNPDTLYAGASRLYRTTDGALSWEPISPPLGYDAISAIGPAPSSSNVIYVGSYGGLDVTTDGGNTWTETQPNGLPYRYVSDIAVDPNDATSAYVTLSGFDPYGGSGHVFHTANTGGAWADISGDLPNIPVNALAIDPRTSPPTLYAGTDGGVFRSTDGGATWDNFNKGSLPNVVVQDLLLNTQDNTLVAATHGRSAWVTTISKPADTPLPPPGTPCPAPAAGKLLDDLGSSIATIDLSLTDPALGAGSAELFGHTCILRDAAAGDRDGIGPSSLTLHKGQDDVETEIVQMFLSGTAQFGADSFPMWVTESLFERSIGYIEEQPPNAQPGILECAPATPCTSFFDVFLYVYVDTSVPSDGVPDLIVKNMNALTIFTTSGAGQAEPGDHYLSKNNVALVDQAKSARGTLGAVTFTPVRELTKLPALQNLFLTRQGEKLAPVRCQDGTNVALFTHQLSAPITSQDPKDPAQLERLGAFEFEVRYDEKLVCVQLVPGPAASSMVCTIQDATNSTLKGIARIGCVSPGKNVFPDTHTPEGRHLADIVVRPQPELYSQILPNQDNGIAVQILNQGCQLSDLQGHPIPIFSCDDGDVTIRYLEGDVTGDCIVDVMDAQQVAFRWASTIGSLFYGTRYDLMPSGQMAGDGEININDLQFVFGRLTSMCQNPWPPQLPVNPKA